MKTVLCYGDSNTFGYVPKAYDSLEGVRRYSRDVRWPGRLQTLLGGGYHVIEEGLSGRTTVFDDPTMPGRRGIDYLLPCLMTHQPVDLLLIMLGTNDTKVFFAATAKVIASGLEELIKAALNPYVYDARKAPQILVVSPILLGEGINPGSCFDQASAGRAAGLADAYREVAGLYGCHFFNAALHAEPSPVDGVHLDEEGHRAIAEAMAGRIKAIL